MGQGRVDSAVGWAERRPQKDIRVKSESREGGGMRAGRAEAQGQLQDRREPSRVRRGRQEVGTKCW